MENILIYLLIILCIGLIIALAVYMKRYNEERENAENTLLERQRQSTLDECERLFQKISDLEILNQQLEKKLTRKGTKWKKRSENPDIIPGYDPLKEIDKMTATK